MIIEGEALPRDCHAPLPSSWHWFYQTMTYLSLQTSPPPMLATPIDESEWR